ncbi:ribosomal protein L49/IMG2 [Cordyceps fumosorosea ARSEF 2679]|uniref:Large ribosomal subunit protein mL49 n=1 Tax=Cordyceps fumosorosea (strain ARSEF 2679) TaxID=1081104 RepID=A0A168EA16_CORFA|nr:ribosomal protein L49/IMG2 [Cordyceps fumosorosea ARSEF 2679]OAA73560.1 ribosomal protein L49/IMG2 [Cordyceps fumosorosea ARSEF 2679]
MNSRLSQSLPCVRAVLSHALSPRPFATPSSTRSLLPLSHSYATAATAAATTRAAEQRRAPRSFARPPTPPPSKTPEEQSRARGYLVQRTASAQLPVYRALKSGGTREVILVKKVHGDRRRLVEDIKADLAVAADRIRVNPTTQHVELQGNYLGQTQKWLLDNGF